MNTIQLQIIQKLALIEGEQSVRIPLAVESGSRAWGFASPNSDYDCRFVYVRPVDFYLSIFDRKDTLDYVPDPVFDLGGWDLRKFIRHLVKSNAVMLEWLRSGIVYRKDEVVWEKLWALGQKFFNPISVSYHYLSMARNKMEEVTGQDEAKIKTYFYIMRPLACIRFIREQGSIPFMEYRRNLDEIFVPETIRFRIETLMEQKSSSEESEKIPHQRELLEYFSEEIVEAQGWLAATSYEKNRNYEEADICFREILQMVNAND